MNARRAFIVSVIAWAVVLCICVACKAAAAEPEQTHAPHEDDRAVQAQLLAIERLKAMDDYLIHLSVLASDVNKPAAEPEIFEAEDFENEKIEAALIAKAQRIDDVTVTHYDACLSCCGKTDGITKSGAKAVSGVTVAVDPKVIPLGSDVLVDYHDGRDIQYYKAQDIGGAIKGAQRLDVYVDTHKEAIRLGKITGATVYWIAPEA